MDIETLTNSIANLGKHYFENAAKLVLTDVFNLNAVNVDGKNDGGTDYAVFTKDGQRINACYQITTQKSDIKNKAYKDAKKSISKLGISKFYFLSTYLLSEIEKVTIKQSIETELDIQAECYDARIIAGLILSGNLLNIFLSDTNYPLPQSVNMSIDYKEMALHSYTLLSDDTNKFKSGVFDDTIAFMLSEKGKLTREQLISEVNTFLDEDKTDIINRRIDSLLAKSIIQKQEELIGLKAEFENDWKNRKRLYQVELSNLSSAQVDLLRNEFATDWTEEDSKKSCNLDCQCFYFRTIKKSKRSKDKYCV